MKTPDGRLTLVYNGEIYNYLALREQLRNLGHGFRTDSDTEVLLMAWRQWGEASLPRLEGMFAFAVHDAADDSLTLARDAFGIKPLVYEDSTDGVFFASEPAALLALTGRRPRPNWQRCYDYLASGEYDTDHQTFFDGIHQLQPAHVARLEHRGGYKVAPQRWWRIRPTAPVDVSFEESASELRTRFVDSVSNHLRSDVPLGIALSGGIDSSAVASAARMLQPRSTLHTFSFIASGSEKSEEGWIDEMNEYLEAVPHKVYVEGHELERDLEALIRAQGEPFGSTSIYAQMRVFKAAREAGMTVMLDGQGADELLGGYDGYPGARLASLVEMGRSGEAVRFARAWCARAGRPAHHAAQYLAFEAAPPSIRRTAMWRLRRRWDRATINRSVLREGGITPKSHGRTRDRAWRGQRLRERLAHALRARELPALLRHADRNAMTNSLESRVPFLTTTLAEYALSLPEDFLVGSDATTKRIFRRAMRGMVPDAVLDRRDKVGFASPDDQLVRAMAPRAAGWLEATEALPFVRTSVLIDAFNRAIAEPRPVGWQAWRWINLARWLHVYDVR